jgi:mannobiose 2-epimerase
VNYSELNQLAAKARSQAFDHILPFWAGPALDLQQGGWMAWLSNDLAPDRIQPKGLIVHARILWAFAAAFRVRPDPIYRKMADRALDYLLNRFWDEQYGGAFWRLTDSGEVLDDSKKSYGQAFCIYALAEYHQAFAENAWRSQEGLLSRTATGRGSMEPLGRVMRLFDLLETHAHDAQHGGYFEVCQRDWSEAKQSRLSDKDMDEKKSMNNHLHVLEAYTNLYRVWKEPRVEQRLRELIDIFAKRIIDLRTFHFHHFFDEEWSVRSDTYTFGHDIEGSWLLCEAAEALDDSQLLAQVRALALKLAERVLREGLAKDGALCYEGRNGAIIDRRKECWPQAEAVVGFLNAFQLTNDQQYFRAAQSTWAFI